MLKLPKLLDTHLTSAILTFKTREASICATTETQAVWISSGESPFLHHNYLKSVECMY